MFISPALPLLSVRDSETAKRQARPLANTHTHAIFRLRHRSSGRAVTQAGAAALVRDLECRGNGQAGWGGRCETDRGGRLIRAAVLEQDVGALLTPSIAGQDQRRLPLSVPVSNITAILMECQKRKKGSDSAFSWLSHKNNFKVFHHSWKRLHLLPDRPVRYFRKKVPLNEF